MAAAGRQVIKSAADRCRAAAYSTTPASANRRRKVLAALLYLSLELPI